MQILIRRSSLKDYFSNLFYKIRFWFFRNFWRDALSAESPRKRDGWDLTFEDDFKEVSWGTNEDKKKWIVGEGWGWFHPDNPIGYYGPPEIIANSSNARFSVKHNPKTFPDDFKTGNPITVPFEVSLLSSCCSFTQQYGRFECKCTVPFERGVWPAFWLWGTTWPPEIDVFEIWSGDKGEKAGVQYPNIHWGNPSNGTKKALRKTGIRFAKKTEKHHTYHHFAVEWYPDRIEFFTDGVKVYQFTRKDVLDEMYNTKTATPWIVINNHVDRMFVSPDETDYNSEFFVDYIRAYKITN
jgi:beta-glucanase (GH16 family)